MLLRGRKRVERGDARSFLTLLHRKVFAQAAGDHEFPIYDREHAAEEKQIPDVRRLDVSPQRCRRRGQHESKLTDTRTWTGSDSFLTTWRRHVLLHQFECFRHSPWAPIASRTRHPQFPRLEPVAESGGVFSGTRGRRWRASE